MEPHRIVRDSRPTILIVDDHSDLRDAMTVLLQTEGYIVADATNGRDALAYLRSGASVSAIILDLDMPVMNGWDFIAAWRAEHDWRRIPVLVVTALDAEERGRGELYGLPIFRKPFSFDALLATVRRMMIRTTNWSATETS